MADNSASDANVEASRASQEEHEAAAPAGEVEASANETAPPNPTARLYEEALAHLQRRQMLSTLLDSECTFRPKTNATKGRPGTAGEKREDVSERLFQQAKEKEAKLLQKLQERDSALTFKPELTAKAQQLKREDKGGPIHESLYQKAKELRERMKARQEAEIAQLQFKPALTKKAKEMKRPGTAADRLYDPEWVRARNTEERNNYDARIASEFQFRPQVNPSVASSSAAAAEAGSSSSSSSGSAPASPDRGAAAAAAGDPSGNPNATHTSPRAGGASGTKGGDGSASKAVFERLYGVGKQHQEALALAQRHQEEEELAKCTFRPDTAKSKASAKKLLGITVVHGAGGGEGGSGLPGGGGDNAALNAALAAAGKSTVLGGPGDAHSRLYLNALERAERLRQAKLLADKAEEEECSFRPAISEGSRRIADGATGGSSSGESGDAGDNNKGSAGKQHHHIPRHLLLYEDGLVRQQARLANEVNAERKVTTDDLINCTFQPSLGKSSRQNLSPSAHHASSPGGPLAFSSTGGRSGVYDDATTGGSSSVHDRLYENAKARNAALIAASSATAAGSSPSLGVGLGPTQVSQVVLEATGGGRNNNKNNSGRKSAPNSARSNNAAGRKSPSSSSTGGNGTTMNTLSAALAAVSPPTIPSSVSLVDLRGNISSLSNSGGKPTQSPLVETNGAQAAAGAATGEGGSGARALFPVSAPTSPFTVPAAAAAETGAGGASAAPYA